MSTSKEEEPIAQLTIRENELVKQSNAIASAAYSMSVSQRRILAALIKAVEFKDDNIGYSVLSLRDVVGALGIQDSAKSMKLLAFAASNMEVFVKIKSDNSEIPLSVPWFKRIYYDPSLKGVVFKFNDEPEIEKLVKNIKKDFSLLPLSDFGKLQSKYAIRIYELAMSWRGEKGKHGNKPGEWFVKPHEISYIRFLFDIEKSKYQKIAEFRRNVIDNPCEEINNSNLGFTIEPDYIRHKRDIIAVKFICREADRDSPRPAKKITPEDEEEQVFIDDHKEEYARIRREVMAQTDLFPQNPIMKEQAINIETMKRLIAHVREERKKAIKIE